VLDSKRSDSTLNVAALLAIPGDYELALRTTLEKGRHRLDESDEPFRGAELCDRANHRPGRTELLDHGMDTVQPDGLDPVVHHSGSTVRPDLRGEPALGLAHAEDARCEGRKGPLDEPVDGSLSPADEVVVEGVEVWGEDDRRCRRCDPGEPRYRAGLGAMCVDQIGLKSPGEPREPTD
jgi:hypothetical protein